MRNTTCVCGHMQSHVLYDNTYWQFLHSDEIFYSCFRHFKSALFSDRQGYANGGHGGITPPNIFKFVKKLVKSLLCCKTVGHNIFLVGQLVKPPLNRKCLGISLLRENHKIHKGTSNNFQVVNKC